MPVSPFLLFLVLSCDPTDHGKRNDTSTNDSTSDDSPRHSGTMDTHDSPQHSHPHSDTPRDSETEPTPDTEPPVEVTPPDTVVNGAYYLHTPHMATDVNGDGLDDLSWGYMTESSTAMVGLLFGRTTWEDSYDLESDLDWSIDLTTSMATAGQPGPVGDLTGDGVDDFWSPAMIFCGPIDETLGIDDYCISAPARPGTFANHIVSPNAPSDLNGDGQMDLLAGVPYDIGEGTFEAPGGSVAVIYGPIDPSTTPVARLADADVEILGAEYWADGIQLGTEVEPAGDTDGDGASEILTYGYNDWVPKLYAADSPGSFTQDTYITELRGWLIAPGFDINSDGYSDLITGDEGQSWVYYGPVSNDEPESSIVMDDSSWQVRYQCPAGDQDGDDIMDLWFRVPETHGAALVYGPVTGTFVLPENADWLLDTGSQVGYIVGNQDYDGDTQMDLATSVLDGEWNTSTLLYFGANLDL